MTTLEQVIETARQLPPTDRAAATFSGTVFGTFPRSRQGDKLRLAIQQEVIVMNSFQPIVAEPEPPETSAARPNVSGIEFQPINVEKALWLLDQLDAFDPAEQRETFEYLRQSLNEDRAAAGERLVFS